MLILRAKDRRYKRDADGKFSSKGLPGGISPKSPLGKKVLLERKSTQLRIQALREGKKGNKDTAKRLLSHKAVIDKKANEIKVDPKFKVKPGGKVEVLVGDKDPVLLRNLKKATKKGDITKEQAHEITLSAKRDTFKDADPNTSGYHINLMTKRIAIDDAKAALKDRIDEIMSGDNPHENHRKGASLKYLKDAAMSIVRAENQHKEWANKAKEQGLEVSEDGYGLANTIGNHLAKPKLIDLVGSPKPSTSLKDDLSEVEALEYEINLAYAKSGGDQSVYSASSKSEYGKALNAMADQYVADIRLQGVRRNYNMRIAEAIRENEKAGKVVNEIPEPTKRTFNAGENVVTGIKDGGPVMVGNVVGTQDVDGKEVVTIKPVGNVVNGRIVPIKKGSLADNVSMVTADKLVTANQDGLFSKGKELSELEKATLKKRKDSASKATQTAVKDTLLTSAGKALEGEGKLDYDSFETALSGFRFGAEQVAYKRAYSDQLESAKARIEAGELTPAEVSLQLGGATNALREAGLALNDLNRHSKQSEIDKAKEKWANAQADYVKTMAQADAILAVSNDPDAVEFRQFKESTQDLTRDELYAKISKLGLARHDPNSTEGRQARQMEDRIAEIDGLEPTGEMPPRIIAKAKDKELKDAYDELRTTIEEGSTFNRANNERKLHRLKAEMDTRGIKPNPVKVDSGQGFKVEDAGTVSTDIPSKIPRKLNKDFEFTRSDGERVKAHRAYDIGNGVTIYQERKNGSYTISSSDGQRTLLPDSGKMTDSLKRAYMVSQIADFSKVDTVKLTKAEQLQYADAVKNLDRRLQKEGKDFSMMTGL